MTLHAEWPAHARRLADTLAERGDLRSPAWHAAVSAVPRHVLVPHAYRQDAVGDWAAFDTASVPDLVYSPETLITALERVDGQQWPVSSSTKPDLMLRMLETLDVRDGHRVLEIGTGTGYNAALLAHRLGDDHVFSVDVDDHLVASARQRLAAVGSHPTLVAVDGAGGLPAHAPFDRIIATCSVPAVPWAWAEQLASGGAVLVDLKIAHSAGNLVHLHRVDDRLEGRFTARWVAFMAMRRGPVPVPPAPAARADGARTRPTTAPPEPWRSATVVWFLAQLRLPRGIAVGYDLDPGTRRPVASTLTAADGSWARVDHAGATVSEAGPTPLWAAVERAHGQWTAAGSPAWNNLRLIVRPDGRHEVRPDAPAGDGRSWLVVPGAGRP